MGGGGGGGGSDSLTHTASQNSQYWPEQLRTEQVSFLLLLLLRAPAKASHGVTCDSQTPTAEYTVLELREHRSSHCRADSHTQSEAQGKQEHTTSVHTYTTLFVCYCECVVKQPKQRHIEMYSDMYIQMIYIYIYIYIYIWLSSVPYVPSGKMHFAST